MGKKKQNSRYGNRNREENYQSSEENTSQSKVILEPKTENQKNYLHEIRSNSITLCCGPAGSGKTLIPVGYALQNLMSPNGQFKKLIIVRSTKEACGEQMGFLPGDIAEKSFVWLGPVIDNLRVFLSDGAIECLFRHKKIECLPIAYMRGRSLNETFIVVDEAQNCTPQQMLMILTRLGEDSKLVVNGDILQSDLPKGQTTGLEDAIDRLNGMEDVGIVQLDESDIVRNSMIAEIIRRYQ